MSVTQPARLSLALRPLRLPALDMMGLATGGIYLVMLLVGLFHFTDPDYWWHLATGRYIIETGSIPTSDPFAYTITDHAWITHEWLAEVVIYEVQSSFGYAAIGLLCVGMGIASVAIMHATAHFLGASRGLCLALAFWAAVLMAPYWTVRPMAFTWLFFAVFVNVIVSYRQGRDWLWVLPVLMIPWANLHAGFVMGLGLLGLLLVVEAGERLTYQHGRSLLKPALVFAVAFLLTAVNPHTFDLWLYPLTYAKPGNASSDLITEWQSPNFHEALFMPLGLAIALLAAVGAVGGSKRGLFLPILAFGLTFMVLQSVRHQPLFALVFLPVVASSLSARYAWARPREMTARAVHSGVNWAFLGVFVLVVFGLASSSSASQLHQTAKTPAYPKAGVELIKTSYPNARIFNDYIWGGYLINELGPGRVFIDGRADYYGDDFVERTASALKGRAGWQALLDEYRVDLVIVKPGAGITARLREAAGWRVVLDDAIQVVFVRDPM